LWILSGFIYGSYRAPRTRCRVRCYAGDEGRPLGVGLQEQAPNHLKLRWLSARVVSVKEKSRHKIAAGMGREDERKRTTADVSKS
jgi:hypothetical protein